MTSGMASPSACGHAMTSTVTVLSTAMFVSPSSIQTTNVTTAGRGRDVEQQGGGAIGERLRPRPRRLRFGDEALDAGQRGVVTDGGDPHADRRVGRDGAGHDAVAGALRHRARLTGDHRFVDLGFAVGDVAVGGHPRAGSHQHDIARPQRVDADRLDLARFGDAFRFVGQQRGQRRERALGLPDRVHLEPVAEQHDVDQQRELPPEVEIEAADVQARRQDSRRTRP